MSVFDRHREGRAGGGADGTAYLVKVTAGSPVSRAPTSLAHSVLPFTLSPRAQSHPCPRGGAPSPAVSLVWTPGHSRELAGSLWAVASRIHRAPLADSQRECDGDGVHRGPKTHQLVPRGSDTTGLAKRGPLSLCPRHQGCLLRRAQWQPPSSRGQRRQAQPELLG